MESRDVSFLTFFIMWARLQRWEVPMLHVRMCMWLEDCKDPERVMMVFRGAAKSTIYAVYKAWKLYRNRHHRSLVWSADNDTAGMLTADTINVLRNHPLTQGMLPNKPGAKRFWVMGARDARNASMRAVGVTSNATGARADDVDFDDIEVPGNIETPEARLKLRQRISESTHIAVPGAQKTYIGTPHAHDSIYPEQIAGGAAVLKIPLFEHVKRYNDPPKDGRYTFHFPVGADGLYVMLGIFKQARMATEGVDYVVRDNEVVFASKPAGLVEIASMCAWPERFNRQEVERRRKETRTLNAWDSQYMLEAKPITDSRLDPDKMIAYDVEPTFREMNGEMTMWLGKERIVSASCRWDPAGAKLKSDVSALCLILQGETGRMYWHRAVPLIGEIAELNDQGKIIGGQVWQICDVVEALHIPRVVVETNGVGTHAPNLLAGAFKARRLRCAAKGEHTPGAKNPKILGAFEGPLSGGYLWAHVSVLEEVESQMKEWNPAIKEQPDDYLDAAAEAINDEPVRVGRMVGNLSTREAHDWRPGGGVHEVEVEGM